MDARRIMGRTTLTLLSIVAVAATATAARGAERDAAPLPEGDGLREATRARGPRAHLEVAGSHFFDVGASGAWQPSELGYGVVGVAALEWALSPRIGAELRAMAGRYREGRLPDDPSLRPSGPAGFFAAAVGVRVHPFHDLGGLFAAGSVGLAATGSVYRPVLDLRVGWDFLLSGGVEAGPYLGYLHVTQPEAGQLRPQDARAWLLGLSLSVGGVDRPHVARPLVVVKALPKPPEKKEEPKPAPNVDPCEGAEESPGCPGEVPPKAKAVKVEGDQLILPERIQFEYGAATIAAESLPVVQSLAKHLLSHPEYVRVKIDGHTDDVGDDLFNMRLSIARAEAVRLELVALGVPGKMLLARGFGKSRPRSKGQGEEARRENRRVEFKFEVKKP